MRRFGKSLLTKYLIQAFGSTWKPVGGNIDDSCLVLLNRDNVKPVFFDQRRRRLIGNPANEKGPAEQGLWIDRFGLVNCRSKNVR